MLDNYEEWDFNRRKGAAIFICKSLEESHIYTISIRGESVERPDMNRLLAILEDPEQELC